MDLSHKIAVEALEQLQKLIEAFDQPHYGDLEQARDTMFDAIEPASAFVERADRILKERGLIARPLAAPVYRRAVETDR